MNAVKLERMFAKPFLRALDDHSDGITCMSKNYNDMTGVLSGAADGEVLVWNFHSKTVDFKIPAHEGAVRGLTYVNPAELNLTD